MCVFLTGRGGTSCCDPPQLLLFYFGGAAPLPSLHSSAIIVWEAFPGLLCRCCCCHGNPSHLSVPAGEEWYLCRLTLATPSQAGLQWTMSPRPYLAAVGPDAPPGSVVYRLSARQREGALGSAQFFLLDGKINSFIRNGSDVSNGDHFRGGCRQQGGGRLPLLTFTLPFGDKRFKNLHGSEI